MIIKNAKQKIFIEKKQYLIDLIITFIFLHREETGFTKEEVYDWVQKKAKYSNQEIDQVIKSFCKASKLEQKYYLYQGKEIELFQVCEYCKESWLEFQFFCRDCENKIILNKYIIELK